MIQSSYIARFSDGRLVSVYYSPEGIAARICENGRWLSESILLQGAQSGFTASFAPTGELRVYAQDDNGGVVLLNYDGTHTSSRVVLENSSSDIHTILFHSLGSGNQMSLIYNIPEEENRQKLIIQNLHENGGWDKPEEIALFQPFPDGLYEFQQISESHGLAFYRSENGQSGYREITPGKISEFTPLQRQGESMQDHSFLTTQNGVHALYISANLFSSRLVYRRKVSESFDNPVLLWEGQWLNNCLLSEIDGGLYVFFQAGGTLYMSRSSDNGQTFSRPEAYRHKFCRTPKKAAYVSDYEGDGYRCFDIYVDGQHPWDIQILPDMCQDFYPYVSPPVQAAAMPPQEPLSEDDRSRIVLMQERMEKLTRENQEYRAQVNRLSESLAEYEQGALNPEDEAPAQSERMAKLEEENNRLKNKLAENENRLNSFTKKAEILELEKQALEKEIEALKPIPNGPPPEPADSNTQEPAGEEE